MEKSYKLTIGIIGGSGFYDMSDIEDKREVEVNTVFGRPSAPLICGKVAGVDVILLALHGRTHELGPTEINYRANIWALKQLAVTHVLAFTACGSLKEGLRPGDLVVLDSFIDRTTKRAQSFSGSHSASAGFPSVCHIPMHPAFCEATRKAVIDAYREANLPKNVQLHETGTMVTIEGPRFSTRAESLLYKSWNADTINMTLVPEVVLAKEAGLSYVSIAMVTDYDCWRMDETTGVNVSAVMAALKANVSNVKRLIVHIIQLMKQ